MKTALRRTIRWMVEHNCLYLISVFLLLVGVYSVMQPTDVGQGVALGYDLGLLTVLNAYELLFLAVTVTVFRRLRLGHDGLMLACIGLLLLFDPTFFNNCFYSFGLATGLAVNGVCLALAFFKIGVLVYGARIPIHRRTLAMIGLAAIFVYGAPALFVKTSDAARVSWLVGLWWVPMLLVIVGPRPDRKGENPLAVPVDPNADAKFPPIVFALPLVAVGGHLWELAKVYELATPFCTWSPVLLAVAVLCVRASKVLFLQQGWLYHALAVLAYVASADAPAAVTLRVGGVEMTHLRFVLLAGFALSYAMHSALDRGHFLAHAVATGVLFASGPTPDVICQAWVRLDPSVLLLLWAGTVWLAWKRWGVAAAVALSLSSSGLACRLAGVDGDAALFVLFQVPILVLLLYHQVGRGSLPSELKPFPLFLLGLSGVAAWMNPGSLLYVLFAGSETVLFFGLGVRYKEAAFWGPPAAGAVGAGAWAFPWGSVTGRHLGWTCLIMAFVTLLGGFGLSLVKEDLLRRLAE